MHFVGDHIFLQTLQVLKTNIIHQIDRKTFPAAFVFCKMSFFAFAMSFKYHDWVGGSLGK